LKSGWKGVSTDDFGRLGRSWCEADVEHTDLETVIEDMLLGQYSNPIGVFGFNTFEGWSRHVPRTSPRRSARRCDLQAQDVPSTLQDFVERYEGTRQKPSHTYLDGMPKRPFEPCIPTRGTKVSRPVRTGLTRSSTTAIA
jgi:hypothetical protein